MKWTDTRELATALAQKFPDIDPKHIRHTQLRAWVLELNQFTDQPEGYNENLLKDIQAMWVGEFAEDSHS
jgi:FeS assembly protein IscX